MKVFLVLIVSCWLTDIWLFASEVPFDSVTVEPPSMAGEVLVRDKPNDTGGTLIIQWAISADDTAAGAGIDGYMVYRSKNVDGPYKLIRVLPSGSISFEDTGLDDGQAYYYRISSVKDQLESQIVAGGPAIPSGQWYHTKRTPILVLMILFCITAVVFIVKAKGGYTFYVRPIAGIDAVDEAIGRATEMGRPILYVPGLGTAADVATIAAFTILGRVARKVAEYNTRVICPNYDPVVMTVCQEVVKGAYSSVGKPDMYEPKDVFFITQDQFPYTAAVNGIILREKPATNFYMGMFYAESLVLAETGFIAGSIQIAGTDQLIQIPFFVCACDYVLMGEELYAASAYLSKEPQQLGTLKAQDWGKVVVVLLIIIGTVFSTVGWSWFSALFDIG
ncbi:MAG: hypothetical protein B6D58_06570 [candidate division Zixibacteria bacterium 4484_95]|nr:MAG: hypothetical protein B6D58_06570 [candidate division Zixibacteria bacterium 4484_95]